LERGRKNLPARSVETKTTRATGDDGDFALEGKDRGEALQLDLFFSGHFGEEFVGLIKVDKAGEKKRRYTGCGVGVTDDAEVRTPQPRRIMRLLRAFRYQVPWNFFFERGDD
jgi:hypothetical protein